MPSDAQIKRARKKLNAIFRDQRIDGVPVRISRGHQMEWAPPLNPGWFGIPDGDNVKYEIAPATVHIDDWLRLQTHANNESDVWAHNQEANMDTVAKAKESVTFGTYDIPTPVLELKASGGMYQEGRSRALGAKRGGAVRMPIWVAAQVYR